MSEGSFRSWFETYLAAFNAGDFPRFGAYYADDVVFHGQAAQVTGREAVLDFYRVVRDYLEETVEVLIFVGAPDRRGLIAELRTTLVAVRDWPEMPTGAMRKGDCRQSINFISYRIADDRFTSIRTANYARFNGRQP
ncbi:conserved hypothetical protein [Altererythrobacter sp. B11]|uniref:nuclear transport factor 2 family protein n=1 Tax=Altererythrobacter sp. B11 TaxID=2060312 RepID=UPI000DC72095|nr:nuclear transport factor 2 family protein [Altererythrobacter sp. B11]BBC70999.1 conserved hypothetical protein [Altererythrobacter sp. B11]